MGIYIYIYSMFGDALQGLQECGRDGTRTEKDGEDGRNK